MKNNKMNLLEIKNLKKANEAIEFLEFLSKSLKNLKFEVTEGFVIEPGKVSYLDIIDKNYKLYDYKEFNTKMCIIYHDLVLKKKIDKNKLYFDLKNNMDYIYSNSKYFFYENIFNSYHLVSWFIKALRLSKISENNFDTNEIIKNFPYPFLEKSADLNANVKFLIDYINLLQNKEIIKIIDLKISFEDYNSLEDIIDLSFEQLVFGGDLNKDKSIVISEEIDVSILDESSLSEDYKFNYIVSFATNYITYDNCSNNLYVEKHKI